MKIGMATALIILILSLPVCAAKPYVEMAMVQCRLKLAGYDPGPIDGLYGRRTVRAVQRFRHKQGLRSHNPLSWYHVLLGITEGQLYKCRESLEEIVKKTQRIAQVTD
jgi:hypothetical protein